MLIEEVVDSKNIMNFLKNNCSQALAAMPLWRGASIKEDITYIDSTTLPPRKAAYTQNTINLLLQILPNWKQFPRRSVICTTDRMYAAGYGDSVFRVFPVNGTVLGMTPKLDFWSFPELDKFSYAHSVNELNRYLNNLAFDFGITLDDSNPATLVSQLNHISENWATKMDPEERFLGRRIRNENSIVETLGFVLDPTANRFSMPSFNELQKRREVWFDGKAVIISEKKCWTLGIREFTKQ